MTKRNNKKNTGIKAALVMAAALAFAAPAATMLHTQNVQAADFHTASFFNFEWNSSNTSTKSDTVKGITREITESTVNGETTTETRYYDADNNELDQELGEKAYEAALQGIENPLDYVKGNSGEENKLISAAFCLDNNSDIDISDFRFTLEDQDDWGDNWMSDGSVLPSDYYMAGGTINYRPDFTLKLSIADEDGNGYEFHNQQIGNLEDPENVTIHFYMEDGNCYIEIK